MSFRKILTIAVVAAALGDGIAIACLTRVGPDGPQPIAWVGLVLLYPAIRLSGLELGSIGLAVAGFFQLFVVCWFVIMITSLLRYGKGSG